MLSIGIKGYKEITVEETLTAKAMGSGTLDVYATPAMIALAEETAWRSVQDELEEGSGTVGTKLEIEHISATPIGMKVRCETKLVAIDRRKLTFEVTLYDEAGKIGMGTHERFIIKNDAFQAKAEEKKSVH